MEIPLLKQLVSPSLNTTSLVHVRRTTNLCDAWRVRCQTHGYLPSLRWYQIYTAWWQLTAQDINPIAYVPGFAWQNFASRPGFVPGPVPLIRQQAHDTATLSRQLSHTSLTADSCYCRGTEWHRWRQALWDRRPQPRSTFSAGVINDPSWQCVL